MSMLARKTARFWSARPITEQGLRTNVSVGVQYLEAWLRGSGAVPIFNLMEDAATAEISRAQVWQWIRHPDGRLSDGRKVTKELFRELFYGGTNENRDKRSVSTASRTENSKLRATCSTK